MRNYLIEIRQKLYAAEPNKVVLSGEVLCNSIYTGAYQLLAAHPEVWNNMYKSTDDFWSQHYFDWVEV